MLGLRSLLFCALIGYVSSQAITAVMMGKIFQFAKKADVTALTSTLNGLTTASAQIAQIAPWAKKSFGTPPKTSKSSYASQTFAVNKAGEFCKHREALKQFVVTFRQTLNKSLGTATTTTCVNLFWTEDRKNNNNLTLSLADFFKDAPSKVPTSKVNIVNSELLKSQALFAQSNPAAAQALMTFTL